MKSRLTKAAKALLGRDKPFPVSLTYHQTRKLLAFASVWPTLSDGAIVECGVGTGKTFFSLAHLILLEGKDRSLHGFDSFRGFPKPSAEDGTYAYEGKWNKGVKPQQILDVLRGMGFAPGRARLYQGFFHETLPGLPRATLDHIALLHVDVDLYESYKTCLHELAPRMAKGGVIVFDEYDQGSDVKKWPGAKKGIDEYLTEIGRRDDVQHLPWSGRGYIRI